jgi:hypothetical protein
VLLATFLVAVIGIACLALGDRAPIATTQPVHVVLDTRLTEDAVRNSRLGQRSEFLLSGDPASDVEADGKSIEVHEKGSCPAQVEASPTQSPNQESAGLEDLTQVKPTRLPPHNSQWSIVDETLAPTCSSTTIAFIDGDTRIQLSESEYIVAATRWVFEYDAWMATADAATLAGTEKLNDYLRMSPYRRYRVSLSNPAVAAGLARLIAEAERSIAMHVYRQTHLDTR